MKKPRHLTKSRFKTALECPTKLYYSANPQEYGNTMLDDSFLKALAKGGYQVGALAKCEYPDGIDIKSLDKSIALKETAEHLKKDNVILFEAAIQYENYFIRVDILKKNKNSIHLLEVKAKSYDPHEEDQFYDKNLLKKGFTKFNKKWKSYLYDIAFQKAVTQLAFPNHNITCSLTLADKSKVATIEGLNQKFLIRTTSSGQMEVELDKQTDYSSLGGTILKHISVDEEVNKIIAGEDQGEKTRKELGLPSFHEEIAHWAKLYSTNERATPKLSSVCKSCEFNIEVSKQDSKLKSGFHECWQIKATDHPITEIWDFRNTNDLLAGHSPKKLITQVEKDDIEPEADDKPGISRTQRQWEQISKIKNNDSSPYVDIDGLAAEEESWVYPLNFIDFETSMVALPFNKGRRPYEQIAFQFSHHILHKNGYIEHANEYINVVPGKFPNFDFVRALKAALEKNKGSIFRYSNHENTVLCQIYDQLHESNEADRDLLCEWIQTITSKKDKKTKSIIWTGERNMIDQWEIVKRHYYHPLTNGSNSIKYVLPAVLTESSFLKQKYSNPIYGAKNGIESKNFENWVWFKLDKNNKPTDPYKLLGALIDGYSNEQLDDLIFDGEEIRDGGAAATGYAMMQFSQMIDEERTRITESLLRYCELDTFAMVMITEHWLEILKAAKRIAA